MSLKKKLAAFAALGVGSVPAYAVDEAAITAATTAATSAVNLTTSGVIAIAAIAFGLGIIVKWLAR